ncbi:MAG: hypothetical protein A2Y12_10665 [Planctomycetes bacterium GWF2_42_9]|nr:MAG: hypothetical protein A2Y12_10665 [Planctomycetes bacterium GWF2_42_9]
MIMRFLTMMAVNVLAVTNVFAFYEASSWNIAARPRQVNESQTDANYILWHNSVIYVNDSNDTAIAGVLRDFIKNEFGFDIPVTNIRPNDNIIELNRDRVNNTHQEEYRLNISSNGIIISGYDKAAVRNGVALLMAILSDQRLCLESRRLIVPHVQISDWPAMSGFRGMHIQMYSIPVELDSIKRFIDGATLLRLNTLIFDIGHNWQSTTSGANGSYTRANLIELVQYAKTRGFTVIPSMNLLAHSERGPIWHTAKANGIDMSDSQNYILIGQILDEIKVIFDNPVYFHAGMDEAVENIQSNAATLAKTEKNTFIDHIIHVNNMCKARGMQMMIWHDMLVTNAEVSEVATGTPGPEGTAAARNLVPDDIIIGVWDYNNGGGLTCIPLFMNAGNQVFGCGWLDVSVPQMANAVLTNNIAGMITGTWSDVFLSTDPIAQPFLNHEHYCRALALTGHYSWYTLSETQPVRSEVFDPTAFSNMCRWERTTRRIPRNFNIVDLSSMTAHRNSGDTASGMISEFSNFTYQKDGLTYFKGVPFKVDLNNYMEWQSQFNGSFNSQDHQNSSNYKHRVTITNGATSRTFDVDGINIDRADDQIIIYTNARNRTGTGVWGCESVVSNGKIVLTQYYNSADSRVPRNGFVLSAHGTKMPLISDMPVGSTVTVERVYSDHSEPAFVTNNRTPAITSSVSVPVNRKFDNIVLLHTTVYGILPGGSDLFRYRLIYDDGSIFEKFVNFGKNIGAFNEPTSLYDPETSKNVLMAYSNYSRSPFQGQIQQIYAFKIQNPYPAKNVQSIRFIRNISSAATGLIILGITTYDEFCGDYTLISDFDEDCYVGINDLSIFSQHWLTSY